MPASRKQGATPARHAEVEAKLLVPDDTDLLAIGRLTRLGPYRLRRRRTAHLSSIYLDTPDFALLGSRVALRLRKHGRRWEATAKWLGRVTGGVHSRPELTIPLAGPQRQPFRRLSGILPAQLKRIIAGQPLCPILRTDIRRQRFDVCRASAARGARLIAELALDRVRMGTPEGHGVSISYCEVEVERLDGTARDVHNLARLLRQGFHLKPTTGSKLSRGIELLYGRGALGPSKLPRHRPATSRSTRRLRRRCPSHQPERRCRRWRHSRLRQVALQQARR